MATIIEAPSKLTKYTEYMRSYSPRINQCQSEICINQRKESTCRKGLIYKYFNRCISCATNWRKDLRNCSCCGDTLRRSARKKTPYKKTTVVEYDNSVMTNTAVIIAAKEYETIKDNLYRKSYYSFLKMGREIVEYHLEQSLELDGRFYGADMTMDGYDTLDEMAGMFSFLNDGNIDSVELIRQIRDPPEYD